jgi:hypothetical protein
MHGYDFALFNSFWRANARLKLTKNIFGWQFKMSKSVQKRARSGIVPDHNGVGAVHDASASGSNTG